MSAINRVADFYRKKGRRPANGPERRSSAKNIVAGIVIAALTVLTQIVLRRELAPGEFGTMNALFGLVLVMLVPLAAFALVLRRALAAGNLEILLPPLLNRAALGWGMICVLLLFIVLPLLQLPRNSLHFFTLLAVATGLLAICGRPMMPVKWCAIIGIGAAVVRLVTSAWAGNAWPTAESGIAAFLLAALLAGLPALRDVGDTPPLAQAWPLLRPALVPGLAAISVALALALFSNADRIAAQVSLGTPDPNALPALDQYLPGTANRGVPEPIVNYREFDGYQAAGWCMRALLWSMLPLLAMFYAQRIDLARTSYAVLRNYWIYLAALAVACVLLASGAPVVNALFNPHFFDTAIKTGDAPMSGWIGHLLPGFAGSLFVLGLLQAVGIFALASRRYPECFTLAGCSIAYTVFVFFAGHHAEIMTACMAGGAFISLALVLFVGVVRYARTHP